MIKIPEPLRFFYVHGPHSRRKHVLFGRGGEGERTMCGQFVNISWKRAETNSRFRQMPTCKICGKRNAPR